MGERISGLRAIAGMISGVVAAGVLGIPAVTTPASAATVTTAVPTTAEIVRNHDFRQGTRYWYASPGSRLEVRTSGRLKALTVANLSKRTRSMNARSTASTPGFVAGTRVIVTAQVRTSLKGGTIALRAQEHSAGAAPRWRTSSYYRAQLAYRTITTSIVIAKDGGKVSFKAINLRAKGKQRMWVRGLKVTVVEPTAPAGEWIMNPGCAEGATGWTPSSNATLAAVQDAEPACAAAE